MEKTAMQELIEKLNERIKETPKNEMNDLSWGMQEGILISANEAKKLVALYDFYKGVVNVHGIENNKDVCNLAKKLDKTFNNI